MLEIPPELRRPATELLLSIADDKLMLGHRAADWTGLGPVLEEDIAFSAIAQEEIAHAAELYALVGSLNGRSADAVAYGRAPEAYRCATLVELDDEFDWARAIVRQFFCDHFDLLRFERLANSSCAALAALAARIRAEETTHVEHADTWVLHLSRGSDDGRRRVQAAIDLLAPHAAMLFEPTEGLATLERAGFYPPAGGDTFDRWWSECERVLTDAQLNANVARPDAARTGGRRGRHSAPFTALLDEMCEVFRVEPEAAW